MYSQNISAVKTDSAKDKEVFENIGLVHLCVKRFVGRGTEYEDLFQIGCIGLLKAVANFDKERGLKFSTYGVPVILGELRGFFRSDGLVKVSRSLRDLAAKIAVTTRDFCETQNRSPTLTELAELLGEGEEKIGEALGAARSTLSLTAGAEGGEGQIDLPVDSDEERITEHLSLWQIIEELPVADQKLLALRYHSNKTQKDTAALLGCSQVQVSRRERKILLHMRALL